MRIVLDPHELERTASQLTSHEEAVLEVRAVVLRTLAAPWLASAPSDLVDTIQACLSQVDAVCEESSILARKLSDLAKRAEEMELQAAREFESGLSRDLEPLTADFRLLETCRAARAGSEMRALSVGGLVNSQALPGVSSLGLLARGLEGLGGR